jgi:PmbA protein
MEFDILSIHQKSATAQFEGNSFNALKNSEIKRHGLRRFENGRQFQSSRIGSASEDQLLAESREWGGPGTPHSHGFAPAHREKREGPDLVPGLTKEFEQSAREFILRHPDFVFSGKCTVTNGSISLRSSYGLDLGASGGSCEWYLAYQRKGSGNMFDGVLGETTAEPGFQSELAREEEYLVAQKREAKLSSGRMPVLFASAEEPIAKLIESFFVQRYREGTCVYAGKLGAQLFSPQITIFDQSYDPQHGIHQFFDGEGMVRPNEALTLVDKGRFQSLITDLRFGKKYGLESTGNGVRAFNSGVSVGLRSLRFGKGNTSWRETLKGLDRCVVAIMAVGGDSNDLGEYSSPVQIGYVFEKGEIVGRAPQITVKTSVSEYLGNSLISVSSDGFTASSLSPCLISEMEVLVN